MARKGSVGSYYLIPHCQSAFSASDETANRQPFLSLAANKPVQWTNRCTPFVLFSAPGLSLWLSVFRRGLPRDDYECGDTIEGIAKAEESCLPRIADRLTRGEGNSQFCWTVIIVVCVQMVECLMWPLAIFFSPARMAGWLAAG